ncbi:MAG TPA: DUF4388 domain-containing protein [Kofleriaceae bacterium]|nr:DUF4388 domain-containing protein [Kofleriaceae bacterium]
MSLSGDLEDLSVVDLLQFVHLGGRSGTLVLERDSERAQVTLHRGRIIGAHAPATERVGDRLVREGIVTPAALTRALTRQREEPTRRSLGQILVEHGALPVDVLRSFVVKQIEEAIIELIGWRHGHFHFEVDELRAGDEINVDPGELLFEIDLNTQMLLLDAMRIFDERNARDGTSAHTPTSVPAPAKPRIVSAGSLVRHRVQLLGVAVGPARALAARLPPPDHAVVAVNLREAGSAPPGESPPAVVIDLGTKGLGAEAIAQVRRARPRALVVAITDGGDERAAFEAGALVVLRREPELVAAALRALWRGRHDQSERAAVDSAVQAGFAKLRAVFSELRSGMMTATVSLTLMNTISDAVERAVMFAVRRRELSVLGAFGMRTDGGSLAHATRGLTIPLADAGALAAALQHGRAQVGGFDEQVPAALAAAIGKPRSGQYAIFPVAGAEREIAVIYADNGASPRAIEEVDVLELAAAHVGISFENELLRRRGSAAGAGGR